MYLLIHTMTVTQSDCVMETQYFHTLSAATNHMDLNSLQLVAKRTRVKLHPSTLVHRNKLNLHRALVPNLKTIAKRKYSHVKHHIRTIKIVSPSRSNDYVQKNEECTNIVPINNSSPPASLLRCASESNLLITNEAQGSEVNGQSITAETTVQQTAQWLSSNRFSAYMQTFAGFIGADMLRMSRDDLIQICGQADGIRLFNSLHSKSISPKLTIYVCRESSSVFHAIYLMTLNSAELCQKLSHLIGIAKDQIKNIYCLGPHGIHVLMTDDYIKHVKEESMFSVEIISDNNGFVIVLKPINKQ